MKAESPFFSLRLPALRLPAPGSLLLALVALAGCATSPTEYHDPAPLAAAARRDHNLEVFDRAWSLVNRKYFDAKFRGVDWAAQRVKYRPAAAAAPDEEALYRVLNAMNAELKESHLAAIAPRRAHERETEVRAAVGIRWTFLDGKRVVDDVVPAGPAARAGVQTGWFVVSRNDAPIPADDHYIARVGQAVTYGFLDRQDQPRSFTFVPQLLSFVRRDAQVLAGGILYVRFDEFDRASLGWLSENLKAHRTAPAVIIDLRSNPGGNAVILNVAVAEFFDHRVDEGELIKRNGAEHEERSFSWFSAHYHGDVVILTSPNTGSAAEIFSHVLQHHHRARLVGRPTAGAVIYAGTWPLPGGGSLQVPIIDYVGLDGRRIEGHPVQPDVVVPPPSLADLRAGRDPDLDAALKLLHSTPLPGLSRASR
ncbi:MAG TPA: S41 family peptidase [Lacunisphaera sp.]|nr:S41 family peptidase [Lacunisphaera sp.]